MKGECKLVNEQYYRNIETNIDNNTVTATTHMLVFPYEGEKGENLIKSLNKHVKKVLPENYLQICWLVSIWSRFLADGVSERILAIMTPIWLIQL